MLKLEDLFPYEHGNDELANRIGFRGSYYLRVSENGRLSIGPKRGWALPPDYVLVSLKGPGPDMYDGNTLEYVGVPDIKLVRTLLDTFSQDMRRAEIINKSLRAEGLNGEIDKLFAKLAEIYREKDNVPSALVYEEDDELVRNVIKNPTAFAHKYLRYNPLTYENEGKPLIYVGKTRVIVSSAPQRNLLGP